MRGAGISSIYHQANGPAPTGAEAKTRNAAAMADAWHRHGMLVVNPNDINASSS